MNDVSKKHQGIPSTILLTLLCLFILFPFYCLLLASLKPSTELMRYGLNLRLDWAIMSFKNYASLLTERDGIYLTWYFNSILITVLGTVFTLVFSCFVGYGLGAYRFKGRNALFTLVLGVMMIPVEILLLPLFKLETAVGLINSYAGVIVPFVVSPMAVFFFRQYAEGLPHELMDAGRIDGCNEYGIFLKIMLPIMSPAFGAMTILLAMNNWNALVWPLIVLRSQSMFTLPIGLSTLLTPYGNNYDMLIAGAVVAVVPIVILFLFNQKAFIEGLTVGSVKG